MIGPESHWLRRAVLTSLLVIGLASIASWSSLGLLGVSSPYRVVHNFVGMLLLVAIGRVIAPLRTHPITSITLFAAAVVPCHLGTVFPDLDLILFGIGGHRNPLFHSGLSFIVLWLGLRPRNGLMRVVLAGYGIGLTSHLAWDLLFPGDVRWIPGGFLDSSWLLANAVVCGALSTALLRHTTFLLLAHSLFPSLYPRHRVLS